MKTRAALIHLLTASGLIAVILSAEALWRGDAYATLLWLAVAVVIDGIDGPLARRFEVTKYLPQIDGAILDHIIDYLSYCFIPALMLIRFELVPAGWGVAAASLLCIASLYTFANKQAKTKENDFRGFPALWNLVVFYMLITHSTQETNLLMIVILSALIFAPIRVLHPVRVEAGRKVTLPIVIVWLVLIFAYLVAGEAGLPSGADWAFALLSIYLLGLTIWRSVKFAGK